MTLYSPKTNESVQLFIKHDKTYVIQINFFDSIKTLKELVTNKVGIPSELFNLIYGWHYLKDDNNISDYHISKDSMIYLNVKIKPNMTNTNNILFKIKY